MSALHLAPGLARPEPIVDYVRSRAYRDPPPGSAIASSNRRTALFRVDAGGEAYLKRFHAGTGYGVLRRVNNVFQQYCQRRARKAFRGGLLLRDTGIRSVEPLAWWREFRGIGPPVGYFLYRPAAADYRGRELQVRAEQDPTPENRARWEALVDAMAALVGRLHDAGLRHYDLASGNLLVVETAEGGFDLALIDTDSVQRATELDPKQKLAGDLRSLKRLNLPLDLRRRYLEVCLGERFSEAAWKHYLRLL